MELAATAGAPPPVAVANNYGALPVDVLHDILLRLPANEVCRLRPVCQSWRSLTSNPLFAAAHASRHPHVFVVDVGSSHHDEAEAAEVRAVDLHGGKVIKRRRIRRPDGGADVGHLSSHGDLLCVSHGWGQAYVVDMVAAGAGVVADVTAEHRRTVNASKPQCVLGHVPATGEYKVVRVQAGGDRRRQTTCEVVTVLGGSGGGAGRRWRRRPPPPGGLSIELSLSGSGNVAVVAGLAYFLVRPGPEDDGQPTITAADSIAVFDLATEEWTPATLQGPLSSSRSGRRRRRSTDVDGEEEDDEAPVPVLSRKRFQLVRLGESLVALYCNIEDCSTELWFLEDMAEEEEEEEDDDDTAPAAAARWTKRYTLRGTAFTEDEFYGSLRYHYPLAVLEDGKILVWVGDTFALPSALRAYDPETSAWTDLVTPTEGTVVGMHCGSLLCSNLAGGLALR